LSEFFKISLDQRACILKPLYLAAWHHAAVSVTCNFHASEIFYSKIYI